MNRREIKAVNSLVIDRLTSIVTAGFHAPPYAHVVAILNAEGCRTSRGNEWTPKRLFRMLQRQGYSGLWGLRRSLEIPDYKNVNG